MVQFKQHQITEGVKSKGCGFYTKLTLISRDTGWKSQQYVGHSWLSFQPRQPVCLHILPTFTAMLCRTRTRVQNSGLQRSNSLPRLRLDFTLSCFGWCLKCESCCCRYRRLYLSLSHVRSCHLSSLSFAALSEGELRGDSDPFKLQLSGMTGVDDKTGACCCVFLFICPHDNVISSFLLVFEVYTAITLNMPS